jgi:probable phosphoglycerate mutase
MSETLPAVYLARHGETTWSLSGKHTGLTDIPLTPNGEKLARRLGERLRGQRFARVFTSPLQRASRTCELAGFGERCEVDDRLVEWDYGQYEGKTTTEIHIERPAWRLFYDGCPEGESPAEIARRADQFIAAIRQIDGNVMVFSSGDFLRVMAARWLGLDVASARLFHLATASLSILGYDHDRTEPIVDLWNEARKDAD